MFRARVLGPAALLAIPFVAASARASTPSLVVFAADRAPSVSGEIYRLDPNGRRFDLSESLYQDIDPAVSPDGQHVAFFSNRGGTPHAYEVGIGGRGLHEVGPSLPVFVGGCDPKAAWQPGGVRFVINVCPSTSSKLWIVGAHGKTVAVRGGGVLAAQPWSPDGRVFVAFVSRGGAGTTRALSPTGRALFGVPHTNFSSTWSPDGLLAVQTKAGVAVYDESGHLRFTYRGKGSGVFSWSPDGSRLAVDTGSALVVLSSSGRTVLRKSLAGKYGAVWNGNTKVVVGGFGRCGCQAKSVDVATGKLLPASSRWFDTLSADRKLAIITSPRNHGVSFTIGAGPPAGGKAKTYGAIPGCWQYNVREPAIGSQQFAGRSIVYESWGTCDEPYANLYSVSPGGGQPHRLTDAQAQQTRPALSPDGTRIAYVSATRTGISCAGCSDGIRIVQADGSGMRTLTNPQNCTFDDSPTWSPDGTTILYFEESCSNPGELFTVPAAGGKPHDLGVAGSDPAWGPTKIAYVDHGLYTADPDGNNSTLVAERGSDPAWSLDGRLAYLQGTTLVIGPRSVKLPFARVTSLAWSPDGTRLVLTASKTSYEPLDAWTIETDGSDPVRLTKFYGVFGASWR
jgi:Tol biopolymer transport system component